MESRILMEFREGACATEHRELLQRLYTDQTIIEFDRVLFLHCKTFEIRASIHNEIIRALDSHLPQISPRIIESRLA